MRFTDDQRRALAPILDGYIPRSDDGTLPAAGELGLAADVDDALARDRDARAHVVRALAQLDALAERRGAARFTALDPAAQQEAMQQLACTEDAFPPALMLYTFGCYYKHPRVLAHYGFEARAPHPAGYDVPPTDFAPLLAPVRARGPIWRRC